VADFGFSKNLRLLTAREYQAVFDDAQYKAANRHVLILSRKCSDSERDLPRLGLVVAKKNVRLAVQRNRFKRIIRESFRENQDTLRGLDAIVLARKGVDQLDSGQMRQMMDKLWNRLSKQSGSSAR